MTRPWLWAASLAVYAFLYVPLAVVVVFSFNDSTLNAQWVGFTTHWYAKLLHDEEMLRAAANSVSIALLSAALSTVLGAMAGLAVLRAVGERLPGHHRVELVRAELLLRHGRDAEARLALTAALAAAPNGPERRHIAARLRELT